MTEALLSLFYFLIFCTLISKMSFFKNNTIPVKWFIAAYGIKVLVSIFITLIYTKYYTERNAADIFKYFDDGLIMFSSLQTNPIDFIQMVLGLDFNQEYFNQHYYQKMGNWTRPYSTDLVSDTHIIIRFNAFVNLFSFGHFYVHNIFINFISLIGLTAIFKSFLHFLIGKEKLLFYGIFLTPSVLFWGSGLLKESLIFFGLGLFLLSFLRISNGFKLISLFYILISLIIIIFTKFYLFPVILISALGFGLNFYFKFKKMIYGYGLSILSFLIVINLMPYIDPSLSFVHQITSKQQAFSLFIATIQTNSGFIIPELSDGIAIFKNIPNALINTFIRPFLWESNSLFVFLSALENILILLFIVICLFFRKKLNVQQKNSYYFNITFTLILFIIIGLTTPVFGAIMRYKIPGLILFIISLIMVIDIEKIKTKNKWLDKIL